MSPYGESQLVHLVNSESWDDYELSEMKNVMGR
jgi:hypothetical protein